MAIDTAAKRNSALLDPWGVLPFPDGGISESDRLTLLGYYSGIGADITAPTLGTLAVPSAGTTLTATLSESGCLPASGTGGFTLGGTSATVASWAISGTTLTLTLTGTPYSGETVTLTYSRAATSDDIHDAAGNFLADFAAASVTNNSTQVAASTRRWKFVRVWPSRRKRTRARR